jgi:carbamoyltransferase
MGLAPYGEPKYVAAIKEELLEVRDDGSLRMNQSTSATRKACE